MKLIKFLIIILIITTLALSFTPINLYYDQIEDRLRPVKLEGLSGSIIKGSAQHTKLLGTDLGQLNWLIYPSSYNAVSADLTLRDPLYDISGQYVKKTDSESIEKIRGSVDWQFIKKRLNFNQGEITGYVEFNFDTLKFVDGVPDSIVGQIVTKDLKLIKPIKKELGEIEVTFTADNPNIIVGHVNSDSNVMNVSGAIYIHKNHRWEIKITIIPMPGEYEVGYALQGIGDRRSGGGRSLNMAGFY